MKVGDLVGEIQCLWTKHNRWSLNIPDLRTELFGDPGSVLTGVVVELNKNQRPWQVLVLTDAGRIMKYPYDSLEVMNT
jgi:hypothetical protein